jgi:hypothetical protein
VLHLTARVFDRQPTPGRGSWSAVPAENWVVLPRERWTKLVPPQPTPGTRYEVNPGVSVELLTHFYPQCENNDTRTTRFDRQTLRGRVERVSNGVARVRLDGGVTMTHPFERTHPDPDHVEAEVTGFIDYDVPTSRIRTFRLVTRHAKHGPWEFGAALRSVP